MQASCSKQFGIPCETAWIPITSKKIPKQYIVMNNPIGWVSDPVCEDRNLLVAHPSPAAQKIYGQPRGLDPTERAARTAGRRAEAMPASSDTLTGGGSLPAAY